MNVDNIYINVILLTFIPALYSLGKDAVDELNQYFVGF